MANLSPPEFRLLGDVQVASELPRTVVDSLRQSYFLAIGVARFGNEAEELEALPKRTRIDRRILSASLQECLPNVRKFGNIHRFLGGLVVGNQHSLDCNHA